MEHRERGDIFEITYWKANTAATLASATRAVVSIMGHPHYPEFEFEIKEGHHPHEMDKLLVALAHAYTRGQRAWAAHVRSVLAGPQ